MNIEILTAEYVRAGRMAAEAVLSDERMVAAMTHHAIEILGTLRSRVCPPNMASEVTRPVRQAICDEIAIARSQIEATSCVTPARDKAEMRAVNLRSLRDSLATLEAASDNVLDCLAAEALNKALKGED